MNWSYIIIVVTSVFCIGMGLVAAADFLTHERELEKEGIKLCIAALIIAFIILISIATGIIVP